MCCCSRRRKCAQCRAAALDAGFESFFRGIELHDELQFYKEQAKLREEIADNLRAELVLAAEELTQSRRGLGAACRRINALEKEMKEPNRRAEELESVLKQVAATAGRISEYAVRNLST